MPAPAYSDMVTIGRVIKPQGRRGEVAVLPISDRRGRFEAPLRVFVPGPGGESRALAVTDNWPHKGRLVLKFDGVDTIDDAEKLRGMDLRIPEGDLEVLPAGSYYHHQLRGLRAYDESGRELGVVADILQTGAGADVLVIRGSAGESLVPLAASFIREVDLAGGRLVAAAMEMVDASH